MPYRPLVNYYRLKVLEPNRYRGHRAYLDGEFVFWMTTEWILSQFARQKKRAQMLYHEFILEGIREDRREEFYRGECEGRILGDDQFSKKALDRAEEKFQRHLSLDQIIDIVCEAYSIDAETLTDRGKKATGFRGKGGCRLACSEDEKSNNNCLGALFAPRYILFEPSRQQTRFPRRFKHRPG